jgi:hypothetical protein
MGWLGIITVLLCLGAAVLWSRFNPDRDHTRPPTYRADRRARGAGHPTGGDPFHGR